MTEENKRRLQIARLDKQDNDAVELALELLLHQVHSAMMQLRDSTCHVRHPALIATVGQMQTSLGRLYGEIGALRNEILATVDELETSMLNLSLGLPL